ncbi:MAG: thiol reductant ABC exporter subunit CydD [Bosea sp. (in: a-proteobacteria)]|nr:MAG: thiol reductant ABC exporter subunit CydD [Bosea sp. (in: a-proteobacteria)]
MTAGRWPRRSRRRGEDHQPNGILVTSAPNDLAFLRRLRPLAARELRLALLAGAVAGVMVVLQAWWVATILDRALVGREPLAGLVLPFVLLFGIVALRAASTFAADRFGFAAAMRVVPALRRALLGKLGRVGPSGAAALPPGEIVAALSDGVRAVEPFFSRYLPATAQAAILPVGIFLVVAPLDWLSALVFLVTAPLIPLFMVLIGKGAEALNQRQWLRLQRMSGHFLDAVQGLASIKAFGAGPRMVAEVGATAERYRRDTMAVLRIAFLSSLTLEFFSTVAIAIIAVLIGFRLLWGELDYRAGLFILLLAPEFYGPLRMMGTAYHARMEALGAASRLVALDALPEPMLASGTARPAFGDGIAIRFEDVHLTYPDGRIALRGVTFAIEPGETVAFAGPSGAGKSSIQALLLGFVGPTSGRILIDGHPLETLDPEHWRRHLGFMPQRPKLFAASVRGNIAPGEADPDDSAILRAAERAGIAGVIADLPQGLDTAIGNGGRQLSGGQASRIALARLFCRDAPLALLDEPTAHLDDDSEAMIHAAITQLKGRRTLLVNAHRPASLALAHRIIRIEEGRIAVGQAEPAETACPC